VFLFAIVRCQDFVICRLLASVVLNGLLSMACDYLYGRVAVMNRFIYKTGATGVTMHFRSSGCCDLLISQVLTSPIRHYESKAWITDFYVHIAVIIACSVIVICIQ